MLVLAGMIDKLRSRKPCRSEFLFFRMTAEALGVDVHAVTPVRSHQLGCVVGLHGPLYA